jgi:DNA-binding HxlR family transcriptional regulator
MAPPAPAPDDRRYPIRRRPDQAVLDLIRRPYVAELLAALDEQPDTLAGLLRSTRAPHRHLVAGLRALAAHHALISTPHTGSWDLTVDSGDSYQLTPTGRALIEYLFHLDVWRAAYQPDPPSSDHPPTV